MKERESENQMREESTMNENEGTQTEGSAVE